MEPSLEYVRTALAFQQIPVPEDEIDNVFKRLSLWIDALNRLEGEIGHLLDDVEPIAPIYPKNPF